MIKLTRFLLCRNDYSVWHSIVLRSNHLPSKKPFVFLCILCDFRTFGSVERCAVEALAASKLNKALLMQCGAKDAIYKVTQQCCAM
jgi:hypothetical protein